MTIQDDVFRARTDKTIQSTASMESVDIANHAVEIICTDLVERLGYSAGEKWFGLEIQNTMARAILLAMNRGEK